MLIERFSAFRGRKQRREVINEIVRIFQDVKTFMEIEIRRQYRKTCCTSFFKEHIIIVRSAVRTNGKAV